MNNHVFLDASFWIVYRDESEAPHAVARRILGELFRQRAQFVTTLPVICEIHAYFSRARRKRELVLTDLCNNPLVVIEDITTRDHLAALELLRRHTDKEYSLCDALSFVVMRRLQLERALAYDHHFRQFGEFEVIGGN